MGLIKDWRGNSMEVVKSMGGVLAVADPWNNVVRTTLTMVGRRSSIGVFSCCC